MFTRLCHYAAKCAAICLISAACLTTSTAQPEYCCYQTSSTGYCSIGFSGVATETCTTTINCVGPVCTLDVASASVTVWNSCPWFSGYVSSGAYLTDVWAGGEIRDWNGSIVLSFDEDIDCVTGTVYQSGGGSGSCF